MPIPTMQMLHASGIQDNIVGWHERTGSIQGTSTISAIGSNPSPSALTFDVIVDTDLGGDPDDIQSMVRLVMYSDILKVKGIISTPNLPNSPNTAPIEEWIKRSDPDWLRANGYPELMSEAELLGDIYKGDGVQTGPGPGKSTAGSNHIISVANSGTYDRTTNPLWILVWGSHGTVAQALYDDPTISSKIRLYTIGAFNVYQNLAGYEAIMDFRDNTDNDLWWINCGRWLYGPKWFGYDTFKGIWWGGNYTGEWQPVTFLETNIRGHGTKRNNTYAQILGDVFPVGIWGPTEVRGGLIEGDTPSMMYLLSPVLSAVGDVDDPTVPSWGGQFDRPNPGTYPNYYQDISTGTAPTNVALETDAIDTINIHRVDFLTDFKARWDRYPTP